MNNPGSNARVGRKRPRAHTEDQGPDPEVEKYVNDPYPYKRLPCKRTLPAAALHAADQGAPAAAAAGTGGASPSCTAAGWQWGPTPAV
jgi:hypothetical protein